MRLITIFFVLTTVLVTSTAAFSDVRYQLFSPIPTNIISLDRYDLDALGAPLVSSSTIAGIDITTRPVQYVDNFAFRFTGEFYTEGGPVTFYLRSDDGAVLSIGKEIIIQNDTRHSASRLRQTTVELAQGWHPIRVDYFERAGGETLELTYQEAGMISPDIIPSTKLRVSTDRDNDGLTDFYDKHHAPSSPCDLTQLSDPLVTDFRNCTFNDTTIFLDGTYSDKYFDGSTFYWAVLNGVTFKDSSFKNANFLGQHEYGPEKHITFINADFSNAIIEKHWPYVKFIDVNFSGVSFQTDNNRVSPDSSQYCYDFSAFSDASLVRYTLPNGGTFNNQSTFYGLPGSIMWDSNSYGPGACVSGIQITDPVSTGIVSRKNRNIAPTIFMKNALIANYQTGLNNPVEQWAVGEITTSAGNDGSQARYPVYGDDVKPAYRSVAGEASPWWHWDLRDYYQVDSIRLYKSKDNATGMLELDNAVVLISDWPIGDNALEQQNFDSIARYKLTKNTKDYYDIPVNRSMRYIKIIRPLNGNSLKLSFKKVEFFGDLKPLPNGAATPQPLDYVLPAIDPSRVGGLRDCTGYIYKESNLVENFDLVTASNTEDSFGSRTFIGGDLSHTIMNGQDFTRDYVDKVDFEQTELIGAKFIDASAESSNFRGANLAGADFSGANLAGADFRGANLEGANFQSTNIYCAYFSGEIPSSFSPRDVQDSVDNSDAMISPLKTNSAYGYARASSIDLSTYPAMATDGDTNTTSYSAIEKAPWWELDMGAIYDLQNIILNTGYTGGDLNKVAGLALYVSDWPIPHDLNLNELPVYVHKVNQFSIDTIDSSVIKFITPKTGRYLRVVAPGALGQMRLSLTEVVATTPAIATAPSSSLPLSSQQVSGLVPDTSNLLGKIDELIDLYDKTDANDGVTSARESLGDLLTHSIKTIDAAEPIKESMRLFRTSTRAPATIDFLVEKVEKLPYPPLSQKAKKIRGFSKPLKQAATAASVVVAGSQGFVELNVLDAKKIQKAIFRASPEINTQTSLLKLGKSYIETIQRCSIYSENAATVRSALESEARNMVGKIDDVITILKGQSTTTPGVASQTDLRIAALDQYYQYYVSQPVNDAMQINQDAYDVLKPLTVATNKWQRLFSGGNIYDGFTVWDVIDLVGEGAGFINDGFVLLADLPGVKDVLEATDIVLDPLFFAAQEALEITGVTDSINLATAEINSMKADLERLQANFEERNKDVIIIPNVPSALFEPVMNIRGNPAFASCADKLHLPPQWPTATNDDDGDGLVNAFEAGYKVGQAGEILPVTSTLVDNPDSDLDGLDDYFEWYWSTQTTDPAKKFDPANSTLGEAQRDDDGDGLVAIDEALYKTNPFVADTDGDGINDGQEAAWGTNPLSAVGDLSDLDLDLDGDGIPIADELKMQLDPVDPFDGNEDPDLDGVPTISEYRLAGQTQGVAVASSFVTAPASSYQSAIQINRIDQLNKAITIDLTNWLSYQTLDELTLDTTTLKSSEGQIVVDTVNPLTIHFTPDFTNLAKRNMTIFAKVTSPGGTRTVTIALQMASFDDDLDGVYNNIDAFPINVAASVDVDADGLPDAWHVSCDSACQTASGLTLDPSLNDFDNDLIPDVDELALGLDPKNPNDATADLDGDGVRNLDEYLAGTPIDVDSVAPVISGIEIIIIDANGPLMAVDLSMVTASDGVDGTVDVQADNSGPFAPGRHIITWSAVDTAGNESTAQQSIIIKPFVSMILPAEAQEGDSVTVSFELNGDAANYPVEIPVTLSGVAVNPEDHNLSAQTVTIAQGKVAQVIFNLVDDGAGEGEEDLIIHLGQPNNAVIGPVSEKTLLIKEQNVPHQVSLIANQNSQDASIISTQAGLVTVSALVADQNPDDSYQYDWSTTDNALVVSEQTVAMVGFDPASLQPGIYTVRVVVTDNGEPVQSASSEIMLSVINAPVLSANDDSDADGINDLVEGYGDSDNDGIPEYLDNVDQANVLHAGKVSNIDLYLQSKAGTQLRLGKTALAAGNYHALISMNILKNFGSESGGIAVNVEDIEFKYDLGIYDFELHGIEINSNDTQVVIALKGALTEGSVYRLYQDQWKAFVVDERNYLSSSPGNLGTCPAPGHESYQAGLNTGDYCVQVTIEDGGPNDADATVNYIVKNTGGLADLVSNDIEETGDEQDESSGSGGLNPLLIVLIMFLVWFRRCVKLKSGAEPYDN